MSVNKKIKVGTCGFRITKEAYSQRFSAVEVQHTFYQPPMVTTLERWREAVPKDFEFTLKAWQLITHEASSPTYKRLKKPLTEKELASAGAFRWSAIVKEAWATTLASAKALKAKTVLFQCPAKFVPTPINIRRMTKFFSSVDREGLNFAWEPRGGDWTDEMIAKLCRDLDLWHAVDPFSRQTVTPERCYFRMHGRIRWRYNYESTELEELATLLPKKGRSYVFFNNVSMLEDAETFDRILKQDG